MTPDERVAQLKEHYREIMRDAPYLHKHDFEECQRAKDICILIARYEEQEMALKLVSSTLRKTMDELASVLGEKG